MKENILTNFIIKLLDLRKNRFHPLVFVNGDPQIGKNVYIGLFSEVNARGGVVKIGDNCDIASFVSINIADSHKKCIGIKEEIERGAIILEENVFIGSHSFLGGKIEIGNNSVIAAGSIVINCGKVPPYSLIKGNPAVVYEGYYQKGNINE